MGRRRPRPIELSNSNGGKRGPRKLLRETGRRRRNMSRDQIEGRWKRFTGSARERWGKLTDNNWERGGGKKDQLAGRIQETNGRSRRRDLNANGTTPPAFRNQPPVGTLASVSALGTTLRELNRPRALPMLSALSISNRRCDRWRQRGLLSAEFGPTLAMVGDASIRKTRTCSSECRWWLRHHGMIPDSDGGLRWTRFMEAL
jgi:uncharacterized protein YjbJ (UPF0337 family)